MTARLLTLRQEEEGEEKVKRELIEIPADEVGVGDWAVKQGGYSFADTIRFYHG